MRVRVRGEKGLETGKRKTKEVKGAKQERTGKRGKEEE